MSRPRRRGRDVHGVLLLDKPQGASSNDVLQKVKRIFNANRAGHTGALDPLATGMLPICLGEATKFSQYLLDSDKRYVYELLFIRHEGDELELEVHCSKGTYIRTIIDDLGEKLGCGAHVIYLRRLAVSKYPVERMVTMEHLRELVEQAEAQGIAPADLLDPLLMPMDSPAADFPVVNLPLTSSVYFKNGNPVRTSDAPLEGLVRVTEGDEGKFIGMGEMDGEGRVAPRRLVVEYPVDA